MMIRFVLPLLAVLSTPAPAQEMTSTELMEQNRSIALEVQNQILQCWSLPPGYEDRTISVRLAFFGNGALDGEPVLEPESEIVARRYPALVRSVAQAIENCLPFSGLEALGAQADERFDITVQFQS
jgi:hypothetical protein